MPGERLSSRASRRAWRAAVAVVVLAGLFIGYLAITHHPTRVRRPTVCVADAPGGPSWQLEVSQAAIAATIAGVADRRAMPTRAVAIAYAAAMQESDLADLHYGDRDSVGIFQQRPSEGWGTARQIENPVYASNRFFAALAAVPGYLHMPIYKAAQAVQRSADGQAYAEWATVGSQMALAFSGQRPHAVWCSYSAIGPKARLASAAKALRSTFGLTSIHLGRSSAHGAAAGNAQASNAQASTAQASTAQASTAQASGARTSSARIESAHVSSARQGWAVAAWLVCNARAYGITQVRYLGYEWLSYTGNGRWVRHSAAARAPAATAVVFG